MSSTAVLERERNTQQTRSAKVREVSFTEQAEKAPVYDFSAFEAPRTSSPSRESGYKQETQRRYRPVADFSAFYAKAPQAPQAPEAPETPVRKKVLFDDYAYVNGELLKKDPETDVMMPAFATTYAQPEFEEKIFSAPAYAETTASAATVEREAEEVSEDDALPTRRTMESVIRSSAAVHEMDVTDTKRGLRAAISSLSVKMKAVLISVATAIILAIVLICVNTSIIRSLDSDLSGLKDRAAEQRSVYETLKEESDLYTDPDSEIVTDWAETNGMTK